MNLTALTTEELWVFARDNRATLLEDELFRRMTILLGTIDNLEQGERHAIKPELQTRPEAGTEDRYCQG